MNKRAVSYQKRDHWQGLDAAEARSVYDHIGRIQEWQRFYEGPALRELLDRGEFAGSRSLLELGCGPGTLAEELLARRLPPETTYHALEISPVMAALAGARLAPWKDRARVQLFDGATPLPVSDGSYDRFVAAYVLDLLSPKQISSMLSEAHRVLRPEGLLCIVSLAHGATPAARILERLWLRAWRLSPKMMGGCRPIDLLRFLSPARWNLDHHRVVTAWALSSEILIASRRP